VDAALAAVKVEEAAAVKEVGAQNFISRLTRPNR
jgi:hypothetical protein